MFVLVVDGDLEESATFFRIIRENGHKGVLCHTFQLAEKVLERQPFELALIDLDLSPLGPAWLQRCAVLAPGMRIVTLTGDTSREQEIQARNHDISMYLVRPVAMSVVETVMGHLAGRLQKTGA